MKATLLNLIAIGMLGIASTLVQADPPLRNGDAELVLDFLTAADGALDSPDDLLLDADPCDPDQPDLLEPVLAPDGQWITFGELSQVSGKASINCQKNGTQVVLQLSGLIPHGVYTVWLLTFEAPGFTPDFAHLIGEGALGMPDGSSSAFVASSAGKARLMVRQPAGALSIGGEVGGCLLDEFEFHLVGAYHPDGLTYGPTPGPLDDEGHIQYCYFIEHFGFVFQADAVAEILGDVSGTCPEGEYLAKCPRNQARCCPEGTRCRQRLERGRLGREHDFFCEPGPTGGNADSTAAQSRVCGDGSTVLCLGASVNDRCENNGAVGRCRYVRGSEPACECKFSNRPVSDVGRGVSSVETPTIETAAGGNFCADYGTGTPCEGVKVNSSCSSSGGEGRCAKFGRRLADDTWNCFCKKKGKPCRTERCR